MTRVLDRLTIRRLRDEFVKFCGNRDIFSPGSPESSKFYWLIYQAGAETVMKLNADALAAQERKP
jgi:hypothetical protein